MKKLNLETEYQKTLKLITRKFMLKKCKLYKVRHKKEDTLRDLCIKYLNKLNKMKPWEIPDDENGNAGFVNPDFILHDKAILYTLAKIEKHPNLEYFEADIKKLLEQYISWYEWNEKVLWLKKLRLQNRKKR